jgi:hypothetical protein
VIGAPFGLLALDSQGSATWLQLEPADKLKELAEMAASQGWDAATVQDIGAGRKLVDLELQLMLNASEKPRPEPAFAIDGAPARLYAAIFSVPDRLSPGVSSSYARFIAAAGDRELHD